jgi:CBS domain-containing protein
MTSDPKFCLPEDSASEAAQIMRSQDVGSVPVVENSAEKRIVGMVTDRDLALNVVAEGADAKTMRVETLMTRRPITCRVDDDVQTALRSMSDFQVRRIPVVDEAGRLCGIVSQADLARRLDERQVGEVVEDVSQPGGVKHYARRALGLTRQRRGDNGSTMMSMVANAACLGLGVGFLYWLSHERFHPAERQYE